MKLGQLVNSIQSLQYVSGLKLAPAKSYKITVFLKKAQQHLDSWQTLNTELSQKYATDGKFNSDEDMKEYNNAVTEVFNEDTDIEPVMLVQYPEDFSKIDNVIPKHFAILTDLFVKCDPQTESKTYSIKRFELIHSSIALNQIADQEMPKEAASAILDNLMQIKKYGTEWAEKEQKLAVEELEAFRSENVEIEMYPIKVESFKDVDLSPSLLFQLYWLLEE